MPQTAALSAMQPQHVAYGQAPFQHQPQQHPAVPSQTQIQAQQQKPPSHQQQKPVEEPVKQDNQEPKQHLEESQRVVNYVFVQLILVLCLS